mgnify:CR=1 FL=1
MRTLKKVLALSLVFAMAFTMMAGAAFKDQDKIDSSLTSDIQLLTALGVFKGDENGNFNPTDNVRRSEAAKMIYVLKNNGVDDGAVAFQGVSKYSDVPVGHWAEGYINYCTNLGYMSGWQENGVQKFDPNGNVTGVELMKMLLCMIGYKADVQGYTGNGWQTNVLVDAATSGLSVEFVPSVYGATPRQWTARLMTNALDAYAVSYNKGELTYDNQTYAEFALKLNTQEGILTDAGKVALSYNKDATTYSISLDDDGEYITVGGVSFKTTVDASLLGQDVKVYYREGTTTDTHKVYAVLATGDSDVYETTLDAVTVDKNTTDDYESIKFDGYNNGSAKKYADDKVINLVENLNTVTKVVADSDSENFKKLGNNSSAAIRFVDQDGDGYIDLAFTDVTVYAKVDAYNADKNTLKLVDASDAAVYLTSMTNNVDTEEEFKKLNIEGTIAEDDVVATTVDTTSGKIVINVKKVEPVKATVSGYTVNDVGNAYSTLKIDGTDYKLAAAPMKTYSWALNTVNGHDTFYTDGKYVVYSEGSSVAATVDNLAYITKSTFNQDSWNSNVYKVKAILSDGTTGEYTVNAVYDEEGVKVAKSSDVAVAKSAATSLNGTDLTDKTRYNDDTKVRTALEKLFNSTDGTAKENIFTYSISDGKITLNLIKTKAALDGNNATYMTAAGAISFTEKTDIATINNVQYRTNDASYFFVKDGDGDYSVVKASELKADVTTSKANKMFVAQKVNGFNTLLAGVLEITSVPTSKAMDYYFVTGNASYMGKVDDKYVVELPVNAAGEATVLTFKYDSEASAANDMKTINTMKGKLVTVSLNSDGSVDVSANTKGMKVVSLTDKVVPNVNTWYKANLTTWDKAGNSAVVDGKIVTIADDVKVFNIDVTTDGNKLIEGDSVVKSETDVESVAVYFNADKEISVIFCEVDGADITGIGA